MYKRQQYTNSFIQHKFYDNYLYIGDTDEKGEDFFTRIDLETGEKISNINVVGNLSFYEGKAFMSNRQSGLYLSLIHI